MKKISRVEKFQMNKENLAQNLGLIICSSKKLFELKNIIET